ncbi:MAG: hypothetical protein IPL72_02340 [Sulfuritalea sp.]|nr:hypothetical protein [Sulfuritalea sp.]
MIALTPTSLTSIAVEIDADAATKAKKARPVLAVVREPVVRAGDGDRGTSEWVLRGAYGMPPDDIAAGKSEDMLAVENLTVDRAAAVGQALVWYRQGLISPTPLHLAQSGSGSGLATFDARFVQKTARRLGLDPRVGAG